MRSVMGLATAVLIVLAPGLSKAALAQDEVAPVHSADCVEDGGPIDEAAFATLGSIGQWVTIEGSSSANPVVLMVHGGPGNPNTPYAHAIFGTWTDQFTVVQWDQRGAGKTYGANPPSEDEALTVAQLTEDGVELARYLTRRLGKRKVILMDGSWGSALAVHMAQAEPDLFHAYVGTAQLVGSSGQGVGYERTLGLARTADDVDTVTALEALGLPPWTNPRSFGILRRATRKYEALATDPAPAEWFRVPATGYDTPEYEADYEAGEDYSYIQFVGLAGDGILSRLNLRELGLAFSMPVYLLQGDEDLVTPPEVSLAYFTELAAPHKEFIRLSRTGDDPNRRMIDAQLEVLERHRPEAIAADAQEAEFRVRH